MKPLGLLVLTLALAPATAGAAEPAAAAATPAAPRTEAELMAARQARVANPNRPTAWWPPLSTREDSWYRSAEGREIAERILSWQDRGTGWPLMNPTRERNAGDPSQAGPWGLAASLIKSTVNEMRFLARAYRATGDERHRRAVQGGLDFILAAQHPTGGWPHNYPLRDDYRRNATLNDDEMSDLMTQLREVAAAPDFEFLGPEQRRRAEAAFARGVDFLLKAQIVVNGRRTAWAQQHDPVTFEPRSARAFEPAAISGGESASVLLLLMSIAQPSPEVVRAIEAGVAWYREVQINGLEVVALENDRAVRANPNAPPLWARFYEIGTNRPIFVGRDSIVRYQLAEIEKERRGGYAWYNSNGTLVFTRHAEWVRTGRGSAGAPAAKPARASMVEIHGADFLLNGRVTYEGRVFRGLKLEGLLLNARLVQGIFDDRNPETRAIWNYPDGPWDAERNTREFVAAMPRWRRAGLLSFTINLQGGSPTGYGNAKPWWNSAIDPDGALRPDYLARLERILDRADELGMAPIVSLFYGAQQRRLEREAAVVRAVDAVTEWLIARRYAHVLVEIANEGNGSAFHEILRNPRAHELIRRMQERSTGRVANPAGRLLVSTSFTGRVLPPPNVVGAADFLLLHGNKVGDPNEIRTMVRRTREIEGYRGQPILFNEDDNYGFEQPDNNFVAAVGERASWGLFDFRRTGESHGEGFQSVPVDWSPVSSARKRGFFELLAAMTGGTLE